MSTLETLNFDNLALRKLPVDQEERNYVRTVNGACFSKVIPTPVSNPKLVAYSRWALSLLDIPLSEVSRRDFAEFFSGNKILPGSETAAHCYCGHQFGHFAGQLGDGAAIYLGEIINSQKKRWEIQLKGAGLTPYSRSADGRKVLRSSIREFLCSEAMHFLGIPTTRAGTLVTSNSEVVRDMFYDGNQRREKCTIVLRIAPTFIRFGSFQIFNKLDPTTRRVGPSVGQKEKFFQLLNYVVETFYPEIHEQYAETEKYAAFFKEVVLRTARLVAQWQCVGFCHGVLNTDNMSILGLTIDYGPYGFLDMYDPLHVCNDSDTGARYSFARQPEICQWNLKKLAEALADALPLSVSAPLHEELYRQEFQTRYLSKMRSKLGLISCEDDGDSALIQGLLDTMAETGSDFTNTFRFLSLVDTTSLSELQDSLNAVRTKIVDSCVSLEVLTAINNPNLNEVQIQTYRAIENSRPEILERFEASGMSLGRPLAQLKRFESLKKMTEQSKVANDSEVWDSWLNKYRLRLEKDLDSYKDDPKNYHKERLSVMKANNPRFIMRNYLLQEAIEKAEKGDYGQVQKLLLISQNPYDHSYLEGLNTLTKFPDVDLKDHPDIYDTPPAYASAIRVS